MKCMYCGCIDSKVIDSRSTEDGTSIRRRRECINCGRRFTTYETVENTPIFVIKNNGVRQAFDVNKLKIGRFWKIITLFIVNSIILSVIEAFGGYLIKWIFHKELWNYSNHRFNIGR